MPLDVTEGMVFSLIFLFCFGFSLIADTVFSEEARVTWAGTEGSWGWSEISPSSSRSGLKVGRETLSEVGRSDPTRSVAPLSVNCLSGSLVLLRVLAFRWCTMEASDSVDIISLVLIPSLLEFVGDVLLEKAESLRFLGMFRALDSVEGSEPAEGAGDMISSDSPMAESLLE